MELYIKGLCSLLAPWDITLPLHTFAAFFYPFPYTVAYNLQNLEFLIPTENILYTIINRTVAEVYLTDPG